MIAGKRSPFGPKVELLVVLAHQVRHPIPLLRPILAHRAYASANERGSTGGRLASDHNYEALRAASAWHAHHETALAPPERGSPSLARRMLRGLRPRGGLPAPKTPPARFSRSASKTRASICHGGPPIPLRATTLSDPLEALYPATLFDPLRGVRGPQRPTRTNASKKASASPAAPRPLSISREPLPPRPSI